MRNIIILIFISFITIFAQQRAKTEDGRIVILNTNGTWQYEETSEMKDGIPLYIYNQIVNKATSEYPNEYTVQKSVIDLEIKNYKSVKNYSDDRIPINILNQIKQKVINEYPREYTTQRAVIDLEVKNYLKLKNR